MIEILVAMVILVSAFGLITVLYTRANRVKKIVSSNNDIQNILTEMINTITYGEKSNVLKGLMNATKVYNTLGNLLKANHCYLIFGNLENANVQYYAIAPGLDSGEPNFTFTGTDTTLWYGERDWANNEPQYGPPPATGSDSKRWRPVDINAKVYLDAGSKFEFYDQRNLFPDNSSSETTLVKITLKGKSTDPAMRTMASVPVQTSVRLRNKSSF